MCLAPWNIGSDLTAFIARSQEFTHQATGVNARFSSKTNIQKSSWDSNCERCNTRNPLSSRGDWYRMDHLFVLLTKTLFYLKLLRISLLFQFYMMAWSFVKPIRLLLYTKLNEKESYLKKTDAMPKNLGWSIQSNGVEWMDHPLYWMDHSAKIRLKSFKSP